MANEEFSGFWWLPTAPDHKVPGTLGFSMRDGLQLNLNGNFDEKKANTPLGNNILGETSFGKKITVYQAFFTGSETTGFDVFSGSSSFISQRAFVGCHFQKMEDAKFRRITYHPNHLDEWLGLPIMDFEYHESGFSIRYTRPQALSFDLPDNLTIRILFSSTVPQIGSTVTNINFRHKAYFSIGLPEDEHFSFFGELLFHLNNFLALAVMHPVHPQELEGEIRTDDPSGDGSNYQSVRILQPLYDQSESQKVHSSHMLFTYQDVEAVLEKYINNWFTKRENLNPVFDLFFGVLHNSHSYPVTTFLNYAQALETYHIRTMDNKVDPPEEHRRRVKEILSSVPDEHRDWLKRRLRFGKSPTFAQRLKEVIEINPNPVTGMAGSHEEFIKRVRDSRNYYTHYNPSLEHKAETGGRLKGISIVLGTMLESLLLLEIGFPLDEVQKMQFERRLLPSVWF